MSDKPYDPTLKDLVETVPADWLALVNVPPAPVEVIDADIATVSGAADKVLRVRSNPEWLLHLEFHTGHDGATLPPLVQVRNVLLSQRHELPTQSVVVILRREADSPQLNGLFMRTLPHMTEPYQSFRYRVRRVWEMDPEEILAGGLGLLPLAPISNVTENQLPGIIQRMEQRISARRIRSRARECLWGATYVLLGLRYSATLAQRLLQGVIGMKESVTYQAILQEGRAEGREEGRAEGEAQGRVNEAREILVELGTPHLGVPDPATRAVIDSITDLLRLRDLRHQVKSASSWAALLSVSSPPPRRGRRSS